MVDFGKMYKKYSVPLEQVDELVVGEEYFNEEGHCLRYLGNDEYSFVKQSPLISGELMSELKDKKTLKLFWVLSRNM
jgi:hypothetical protein